MNSTIKLLIINRRRLLALKEQKSRMGIHTPPHIVNEIPEIEKEVRESENNLSRRRQGLLEKAAVQGINTDPAVTIEIEDIDDYFDEFQKLPPANPNQKLYNTYI